LPQNPHTHRKSEASGQVVIKASQPENTLIVFFSTGIAHRQNHREGELGHQD